MESQKPKIPRLVRGVDLRALPLSPIEGFVLSRIDGSATLADIADLTSLARDEVARITDKLHALRVVEWADEGIAVPRSTGRSSLPPRATPSAGASRLPPRGVTEAPRAPLPEDGKTAMRVFAPAPVRAPRLDSLGQPIASVPPPASPSVPPVARSRTPSSAGLHIERPAEEHAGPRPPSRTNPSAPPLASARTPSVSAPSGSTQPPRPPASMAMPPPPMPRPQEEARPPASAAPIPAAPIPAAPTPAAPIPPRPIPSAPVPSAPPPAPAVTASAVASPAADSSSAPSVGGGDPPPPSDGIDLALDRRKRIDDLYVALDLLNHYDILGIPRSADKAKIRSSYFELSKVFHPDVVFRKAVGNYRTKMEVIFSRLTEAYDVLGKKKARAEYDAYLDSLGETRAAEDTLSGEHVVPDLDAVATNASAVSSPPKSSSIRPTTPAATSSSSAPAPSHESQRTSAETAPSKQSSPTEEGRRVAREVLQRRMESMRSQSRPRPSVPPPAVEVAPTPVVPRTQKEALRDLASSLRGAAAVTGGVDPVSRHVSEARRALEANDLAGAVRAYRLALALAPDRVDIQTEHTKHAKTLAISLADRYEQQAIYEERYKKWASAAVNWAKVIEGRPDDPNALTHASESLVEAKGDLHVARAFAQKATELAPKSAAARRALGRVFLAAKLTLNARRELELAKTLDPKDELIQALLREIQNAG